MDFLLADRAKQDALLRTPDGAVTTEQFLQIAQGCADALPDFSCFINLCQDRLHFLAFFAASVLRGRVSLLSSDRSPERLQLLAQRYPDACVVSEEPDLAHSLPHCPARLARSATAPVNPVIPGDQLAAIVFTSGSTGEPVPNLKKWGALAQRSIAAGLRFGMRRDEPLSIVGVVPGQHMYGFETTVLQPLHSPASSWAGPAFYPADIQAALHAVPAPRGLVLTPLHIRALLQAEVQLPAIERVISATAPLARDLAERAEQRWKTEVWEIYGATEVGSIASRRTTTDDAWTLYPDVSFRSAGEDHFVDAPAAESKPLSDVIEVLPDGRFRLLGRKADMVKIGGRRASLAGLNHALNSIEGVADGLFVAPEDTDSDPTARMLAFVVAPNRSPAQILAELRTRLDPVFLPRRIVHVERLPRNEVGKLPLQAVAELQARLGKE